MSSERLKKCAAKIRLCLKIAYIITVVAVFLQTISLLWLTIMPSKFLNFFDSVRIYAPFITDIKNYSLSLFELSCGIISFLFLFIILKKMEEIFMSLADKFSLSAIAPALKNLSYWFFAESLTAPVMKIFTYSVFVKERAPAGLIDLTPIVLSCFIWFLGQTLQTKAVEKTLNQ